jgi:hypothetical protein
MMDLLEISTFFFQRRLFVLFVSSAEDQKLVVPIIFVKLKYSFLNENVKSYKLQINYTYEPLKAVFDALLCKENITMENIPKFCSQDNAVK